MTQMCKKRACLYMRAPQPLVECQRQWLAAFAHQKEMTIVYEIAEYGSTCAAHRPCIDELLNMAEAGEFDVVITTSISRIARRSPDMIVIMSRLNRASVEVWTADTRQRVPYELLSVWETLVN